MTYAAAPRFKVGDRVRMLPVSELIEEYRRNGPFSKHVDTYDDGDTIDYWFVAISQSRYQELYDSCDGIQTVIAVHEPNPNWDEDPEDYWETHYDFDFPDGSCWYLLDCMLEPADVVPILF